MAYNELPNLDQPDRDFSDVGELLDGRCGARLHSGALAATLAKDGALRPVPQQLQQQETCLGEPGGAGGGVLSITIRGLLWRLQ